MCGPVKPIGEGSFYSKHDHALPRTMRPHLTSLADVSANKQFVPGVEFDSQMAGGCRGHTHSLLLATDPTPPNPPTLTVCVDDGELATSWRGRNALHLWRSYNRRAVAKLFIAFVRTCESGRALCTRRIRKWVLFKLDTMLKGSHKRN